MFSGPLDSERRSESIGIVPPWPSLKDRVLLKDTLVMGQFPKNARVFRIYGADGCRKQGNLLSHIFYYGQGLLIQGGHYLEETGRLHSKPHTIHCLDILDIWGFSVYYDVFVPTSLVVTHCLDICKCWNTTLPTLSSWQRSKPPTHWFQQWNWRGIGLAESPANSFVSQTRWITRGYFIMIFIIYIYIPFEDQLNYKNSPAWKSLK